MFTAAIRFVRWKMSKDQKEICLYCKAWCPIYKFGDDPLKWNGECRMESPHATALFPQMRGMGWCLKFVSHPDDQEGEHSHGE
jgi:hypothetical protein